MYLRNLAVLVIFLVLTTESGCSDDPLAADCGSICYTIVSYGTDRTGSGAGDPDCEGLTSDSCLSACESTLGEDTEALETCEECVSHTDDYCGPYGCDYACGEFIAEAVTE